VTARARLAARAADAGYTSDTLTAIAEATFPRYGAGERLDDPAIEEVRAAVETLAQAGHTEDTVKRLIAGHRASDPNGWRRRFWEQVLQEANARYAATEREAAQPCERDPERPTDHAADRGRPAPRAA
jgi:hypothetical protein